MATKQKHFLDSLRQMVSKSPGELCPNCQKPHEGDLCSDTDNANGTGNDPATGTAYLVDLVSNHKIRIPVPNCQVGRDETNDIVVSGDQSISRHHLNLIYEGSRYYLEDNGSRHGTFLNGTQITSREAINDGDVVKIGVSLFWFVVEGSHSGENGANLSPESNSEISDTSKGSTGEPGHMKVGSDQQAESSDPSSSTMSEIPIVPNEQMLLEHLRLKTRSFDQAGLFASAQSQKGTISPQTVSGSYQSETETQSQMPALSLDSLLNETAPAPQDNLPSPETESALSTPYPYETESRPSQELNMSPQDLINGATIYDQVMSTDLAELVSKYNGLQEQIDRAEKERKEIADQLNTIRELGTTLIGGSGQQLIESVYKVFSKLGWQISLNSTDPQELQLKASDHLSIARIIWTTNEPERADLGQLSISQTQQWCEQGQEPKGVLVVSRLSNKEGQIPTLTKSDYDSELAKYAIKKNVCMMTSMQILAIYRDMVLKQSDINLLREKIMGSTGWLEGFAIKIGDS